MIWLNNCYLLKKYSQNCDFYHTTYQGKMKSLWRKPKINRERKKRSINYAYPSYIHEELKSCSINILLWNSVSTYASLLRLIQASWKSYFDPLLNRALLPLHFPATMRYHYTSERMEKDQNTGGFVRPKGLESICVTSFGQKAYAWSEWQRSR